jgi:glycosyltransferase involved in cell wall biosynthesis
MKSVLHYVHHAPPRLSGYAVRTEGIVRAQRDAGRQAIVATWSLDEDTPAFSTVRGLPIFRPGQPPPEFWATATNKLLQSNPVGRRLNRHLYLRRLARSIGTIDIVHAHSSPKLATEAERLARQLGARFVYEVRGIWQLSAADALAKGLNPRAAAKGDADAANRADAVVVICEGLAELLKDCGVDPNKITVVPNGVVPEPFEEASPRAIPGVSDRQTHTIFGYATNVRAMEGLAAVARWWPRVVADVPNALFVLVGDGDELPEVRRIVAEVGMQDHFLCIGRVPVEDMPAWYKTFDVMVVPRRREPVTDLVTPLKPLEAMAAWTPVLASDVGGLKELVQPDATGLLFRADDEDSFVQQARRMANEPELRQRLSVAAHDWVGATRRWSELVFRYAPAYAEA